MSNNLFAKMSKVTVATDENTAPAQTPMTPEQVAGLKAKLMASHCLNVYPNSYDVAVPYRVTIRFNNEFTNYGNFTDINVAKVVGNIASMAVFGDKARASSVDQEAAQKHPELIAWLADSRNTDTIARASGDLPSQAPVQPTKPLADIDLTAPF